MQLIIYKMIDRRREIAFERRRHGVLGPPNRATQGVAMIKKNPPTPLMGGGWDKKVWEA